MIGEFDLTEVAHLPSANDNCAVAKRRLEAGTRIRIKRTLCEIDFTVLEGHRFTVRPVSKGDALLSWGMPFGQSISEIARGSYVCNQGTLDELRRRQINFLLPSRPNFRDHYELYRISEKDFLPGQQVSPGDYPRTFEGYFRGQSRGAGTRNYIVILATSSRVNSLARSLARKMQEFSGRFENLDGVVAIAHTEAGGLVRPNNLEQLLRTLSGFVVHPNVGAVLIVDEGSNWVDNQVIRSYLETNGYPLGDVLHAFLRLSGDIRSSLEEGRRIIQTWFEPVNRALRSTQPLASLKVALQCGGSDSFSGLSSNPLLGLAAREIIRNGGSANLAETNELVGAESYVLSNVKDLKTAHRFLLKIKEFKQMMKWHGHTPEQNPSGGNRLRGLYNIALKSLGAAQKRHPEVRLDYVIEYAERMHQPGYYFMNSPGNDLESVAGQVASGANLVFFSTGNGSITNFPFVPTIKVMSTSKRYELMSDDMDIDAGVHLDGVPLETLAEEMLECAVRVASSAPTKGEKANHSQVSIWRNWEQNGPGSKTVQERIHEPDGRPIELPSRALESGPRPLELPVDRPSPSLALLLPNSLCSSEVARLLADRLDRIRACSPFSKFVSLSHTEGCGAVSGPSQDLLIRTLIGYMTHPLVHSCLLLEHGCENVHHQYLQRELKERQLEAEQFGWVSIQLDGGIERAARKAEAWFASRSEATLSPRKPFSVGIMASGNVPEAVSDSLAFLTRTLLRSDIGVVVPAPGSSDSSQSLLCKLGLDPEQSPSLRYADRIEEAGLHLMDAPGSHWVEMLTGIGATGAELILAYVDDRYRQGHPFIPVLQFSANPIEGVDLVLSGTASEWPEQILERVLDMANNRSRPLAFENGNTDSQVPRGPWGFSV